MSKEKKIDENTVQVKPIIKKRGGCGSFFMGFMFAFVFLIVSIGGVGLYCYYNVTLTQIENTLGLRLPIEGEIRDKSLKDLIALGLEYKDSYTEATLETVETDFGVNLPTTIPGTEIGLTPVYDAEINFLGTVQAVKKYRIQDIANNLDAFVKAVLPILYDNTTVNQVLNSLQVTILSDLGYPALVDKYYNIGTPELPVKKSLGELTISQALEILPEHFGNEKLTVQELINATGSKIMPYPTTGKDNYAGLRNLVITEITTDILLENTDGALLNDLLDLSQFEFAQTTQFNITKLKDMLDYMQGVPLYQIVNIPSEVNSTSSAGDQILFALRNATYNDLQNEDVIATLTTKIDEAYPDFVLSNIIDFSTMQNLDFLANTRITDLIRDPSTTITNLLSNVYIGNFVTLGSVVEGNENFFNDTIFRNINADTLLSQLRDTISNLTISQILNASQLESSGLTAEQRQMTMLELLQSAEGATLQEMISIGQSDATSFVASLGGFVYALRNTTSANFTTSLTNIALVDLIGTENSPSALARLGDMDLQTIAESEDLIEVLASEFGTLGELLNTQNDTGILGIIGNVRFEDLLGSDPAGAIMKELKNSTATLSTLLGKNFDNKLIQAIMNIQVGQLFGDNPEQAFKDALAGENNTLGDLFGFDGSTTPMMGYIANVKFADLLGDNPADAILKAITVNSEGQNITLGEFLGNKESTGIMSMISSVTMHDLLGLDGAVAGDVIMNALGASNSTLGELLNISATSGVAGILAKIELSKLFGEDADPTATINEITNSIKLVDVFDVSGLQEDNILKILYNNNPNLLIKDISTEIEKVTLSQVLGISETEQPTGLFSLVANLTDDYTDKEGVLHKQVTIGTIETMFIKEDLSINDLHTAGILKDSDVAGLTEEEKSMTISQFLQAYKTAIGRS